MLYPRARTETVMKRRGKNEDGFENSGGDFDGNVFTLLAAQEPVLR